MMLNAILVLFEHGYPEQIFALWRTMYELSVVSSFLLKHDQEASEIYRLQGVLCNAHLDDLYGSSIDPENEHREETKKEIKKRYPKLEPFKTYSWVEIFLHRKVNFRDLQEMVDMNPQICHYYKHSCIYVHPQPSGNFNKLGTLDDRIIHCGPSNIGLAKPIQLVLISHHLILVNLLQNNLCYHNIVLMKLMKLLLDAASKEAVKIEKSILEEENFISPG